MSISLRIPPDRCRGVQRVVHIVIQPVAGPVVWVDCHLAVDRFPVWLSVPTAGKLSPQWEGKWTMKTVLSQINMEITDGKRNNLGCSCH